MRPKLNLRHFMKNNTIVIGDGEYRMTQAYLNGAQALRSGVPYTCNPHARGTQAHEDWSWGHTHEAEGEHFRFGQDMVVAKRNGSRLEADPKVPRDENGSPQEGWLVAQKKVFYPQRRAA